MLSRVQADTLITLDKSPVYWKTSYSNTIQSVDFRRFKSDSDILRAVANRQVDLIPELNPNSRIQLTTDKLTLKDDFTNDFNLTSTEGNDYSKLVFNPLNGYGLDINNQNLILKYVNPDSLNSLIRQSGIEFDRWPYSSSTVPMDTSLDKDKVTLAFAGENASGYLARNIYYLADNRLPLTLVKSNVISREITWAIIYENGMISRSNVSRQPLLEIARFSNPRYAIMNNLVSNLSLNSHPWWLNLDRVNIRLSGNVQ
jgi:hypothetical protein